MTDLKDLKELAEAATPGPWEWEAPMYPGQECYVRGPGRCVAEVDCGNIEQIADDNAAFIAAANPKTVLELIARVEAAEDRSAELTAAYITITLLESGLGDLIKSYRHLSNKYLRHDCDMTSQQANDITEADPSLIAALRALGAGDPNKDCEVTALRTALEQAKAREAELLGALEPFAGLCARLDVLVILDEGKPFKWADYEQVSCGIIEPQTGGVERDAQIDLRDLRRARNAVTAMGGDDA